MTLLSSGRYDVGVRALRAALDHWEVVEPWDGTIVRGKSGRIWRGKRGVARLTLARGKARAGGDPTELLTGADQDFRLACERGDKTPEHFACHLETLIRLVDAGEDRLDQADALIEEGESRGVHTREWLGNVADVLMRKAFQIHPSLAGGEADSDAEPDPESWRPVLPTPSG